MPWWKGCGTTSPERHADARQVDEVKDQCRRMTAWQRIVMGPRLSGIGPRTDCHTYSWTNGSVADSHRPRAHSFAAICWEASWSALGAAAHQPATPILAANSSGVMPARA